VRFATFDADIILNQVLGEAVRTLVKLRISDGLRARATHHVVAFEEFTRLRITKFMLDRIMLGRNTVRYEKALQLARLILEGVAPALTYGRTSVVAFLFDMNRLWERFVATLFLRSTVPGVRVRIQEFSSLWASTTGTRRVVKPDILVRRKEAPGKVLLIVDTKWKVNGGGVPSDDELKQMFVYNELFECSEAVLLYPAPTTSAPTVRGTFTVVKNHVCRTAYLGLFEQDQLCISAMQAEVNKIVSLAAGGAMMRPG
jgi:5-methylcytosine-specific restriction enzyme subunit McrC